MIISNPKNIIEAIKKLIIIFDKKNVKEIVLKLYKIIGKIKS